jgi:hypothetical protein
MRNLHRDISDILEYVRSSGLTCELEDVGGVAQPTKIGLDGVEDYFDATFSYHGDTPRKYLRFLSANSSLATHVKTAVREIEAGSVPGGFLLIGYEDGGVISISANELSFQSSEYDADRWYHIDDWRNWH